MTLSSSPSREGSAVNPFSAGGLAAPRSEVIQLMPPATASSSQGWTADLASHAPLGRILHAMIKKQLIFIIYADT